MMSAISYLDVGFSSQARILESLMHPAREAKMLEETASTLRFATRMMKAPGVLWAGMYTPEHQEYATQGPKAPKKSPTGYDVVYFWGPGKPVFWCIVGSVIHHSCLGT